MTWARGAGLVVVLCALTLAACGGSDGGSETAKKAAAPSVRGGAQITAQLSGIPQRGIVLGDPEAKVTAVEFIDPQCPYCEKFASRVMPTIVRDYIRPGKVRFETRTMAFLGPDSLRGAQFLNAAGLQDKQFEATALLFRNHGQENSGYITDAYLRSLGRAIPGLDVEQAMAAMPTAPVRELLATTTTMVQINGVKGTPTVLVGPTGGDLVRVKPRDFTDVRSYRAALDAALAKTR